METKEIKERITPIAREVFKMPDLVLIESLDATQIDTWTSLSFMLLLSKVEEEFGFKFKMIELLKIRNIGNLIQ